MNQELIKLQEKTDKSTVRAGDFNTSHLVTNRTCKLKFTETRDI